MSANLARNTLVRKFIWSLPSETSALNGLGLVLSGPHILQNLFQFSDLSRN